MKSLVPREWKTSTAVYDAKKKPLVLQYKPRGKQYPIFNGSQNNKRNRKRPITLAERA